MFDVDDMRSTFPVLLQMQCPRRFRKNESVVFIAQCVLGAGTL